MRVLRGRRFAGSVCRRWPAARSGSASGTRRTPRAARPSGRRSTSFPSGTGRSPLHQSSSSADRRSSRAMRARPAGPRTSRAPTRIRRGRDRSTRARRRPRDRARTTAHSGSSRTRASRSSASSPDAASRPARRASKRPSPFRRTTESGTCPSTLTRATSALPSVDPSSTITSSASKRLLSSAVSRASTVAARCGASSRTGMMMLSTGASTVPP